MQPRKRNRKAMLASLNALFEANGGEASKEQVLEAARDKKSALHPYFEWDDRKAGEAYRLAQASELIASVKVQYTVNEQLIKVPKYVHPDPPGINSSRYVELSKVSQMLVKRRILVQELDTAISHLERAGSIAQSIDNTLLHTTLLVKVGEIRGYLNDLAKLPVKKMKAKTGIKVVEKAA